MTPENSFDKLLNSSESARIYYGALPDYVRGAVVQNSTSIKTEEELHSFADKVRNEFN